MKKPNSSKLVVAMITLQLVIVLKLWNISPSLPTAQAQIPDAGDQRAKIIDQLKETNEKLDKILDVLKGGDLQVKVNKPDDAKGHD